LDTFKWLYLPQIDLTILVDIFCMLQPITPLFRILARSNPQYVIENGREQYINQAVLALRGCSFSHQNFYITNFGGSFAITSAWNHFSIKIHDFGSGIDGEQLIFGPKTGRSNERWTFHREPLSLSFRIVSDYNGKCMTIADGKLQVEEKIVIKR
jgi:hypothetical protein